MPATGGAIRAGRAFVELFADDSQLSKTLKSAKWKIRNFARSVQSVGTQMMGAGLAIGAPLAIASKLFASFEDQMLTVKAVTGATEEQFESLSDQAKELGRTTSFTAKEVASAQTELGRAGFDTDQIRSATPAILDLARATDTELGEAAGFAANSLRAYSKEAEDTREISDLLTATVNSSNQELQHLGEAFTYIGPIADEAGESVASTSQAIGVLANVGIRGGKAGRALRTAMTRLADPKIQETLQGIGVNAVDAEGNLRPLGDTMLEIGKAMSELGSAERLALAKKIFGKRAMTSGLKLGSSVDQMRDLEQALSDANGVAAATAETMDSGLGGAARMTSAAIEGIGLAVGSALSSKLQRVMKNVRGLSGDLTQWVKKNKELVVGLGKLAGILVAGGALLVGVGTLVVLLTSFMTPLGLVIGGVAAVTGALGGWVAVNKALSGGLKNSREEIKESSAEANKLVDRYEKLASKTNRTEAEELKLYDTTKRLKKIFPEYASMIDGTKDSLKKLREETGLMSQAGTELALRKEQENLGQQESQYSKQQDRLRVAHEYLQLGPDALSGERRAYWERRVLELRAKMEKKAQSMTDTRRRILKLKKETGKATKKELERLEQLNKQGEKTKEIEKAKAEEKKKTGEGKVGGAGPQKGSEEELASYMKQLDQQLHDAKLQLIEDRFKRRKKRIESEYQERKEKLESLGATEKQMAKAKELRDKKLADVKQDRDKKLAREREREQKRREAEEKRMASERENIEYDLARQRIKANKSGLAQKKALLELEEKRRVEAAKRMGLGEDYLDKIKRQYDLREQALGAGQQMSQMATSGTFSSQRLSGMFGGKQKDNRDILKRIEENTKRSSRELERTDSQTYGR